MFFFPYSVANTPEKQNVALVEAEPTPKKGLPVVSAKAKGKARAAAASPLALNDSI